MSMHRALFLDRDGVINVDHGYVHKPEQVTWVEGIFDVARFAYGHGLKLIIVTNQAGIGRGYYSEADFTALMDWMCGVFQQNGAPLTGVYSCPYHPDGIGEYRRTSDRRKPAPGMLLDAAADHRLSLADSFLIGDQLTDLQAGRAAGLDPARLLLVSGSQVSPAGLGAQVSSHAQSLAWLQGHLTGEY
jgi:D-glycero-D-manno-heptose 1,7-bisphosphate phosphatase